MFRWLCFSAGLAVWVSAVTALFTSDGGDWPAKHHGLGVWDVDCVTAPFPGLAVPSMFCQQCRGRDSCWVPDRISSSSRVAWLLHSPNLWAVVLPSGTGAWHGCSQAWVVRGHLECCSFHASSCLLVKCAKRSQGMDRAMASSIMAWPSRSTMVICMFLCTAVSPDVRHLRKVSHLMITGKLPAVRWTDQVYTVNLTFILAFGPWCITMRFSAKDC